MTRWSRNLSPSHSNFRFLLGSFTLDIGDHLRSRIICCPFLGSFVVPYRPSKTITNRAAHTFLARVQSPESSASFRLCLRFQFSFTVKQLVLSQSVPVLAPPLIYSATGQTGTPHCTKVWHKNLSDTWRSSFEIGVVQLSPRHRNLHATTVLHVCLNRSPIRHDSRGACKCCLDSDFALQYGFNMYYRAITSNRSLNALLCARQLIQRSATGTPVRL